MRVFPYKIFHVTTPHGIRTVCISDQIGEKTYIYDGKVNPDSLISSKKDDSTDKVKVI